MKKSTPPILHFTTTLISCLLAFVMLFLPNTNHAQFQRNYGNNLDDSFSKVIQDGVNYYVLGQTEPTVGGLHRATVTRLDANGIHQWTLSVTIASVWNDALLTPNGDLLVVGATLPFDATTKSLMGVVTSSGGGNFSCLRSYDEPGRDYFYRIIKNPVPENAAFPYYILGSQNQAGATATTEDVVLLNVDANCNFNWKKVYTSAADDEFFRDLDVMPNGDLLLSGNGASGLIFRTDNSGLAFNGVQIPQVSFTDISLESGGGILAAANELADDNAYLMKFDQDLLLQWDIIIHEITTIHQVWEGAPGEIYITGTGVFSGQTRRVIVKILDNGPTLAWVKYLNAGSNMIGGFAWLLPSGELAYTDSRVISGGFGGQCAFMSLSDPDLLDACLVSEDMATMAIADPIPDGPELLPIDFWDVPMGTILSSVALNWLEAEVCTNDPCAISIDVNFVDSCGHIQVSSTSTGPQPYSYQWCSGENTPNLDVILPCGPHTFCVTLTCGDGSTATASQSIVISDNIPPTAVCVPAFGVDLDANCMFNVTPAMIDGGSFDNCQIQSMSVSPTVLSGCGVFPITLTVEDWCGNISTCMTEIQTIEVVPPVIVCPPDLTLHCDDDLNPGTTGFATATDNCDPNPDITFSDVIFGQMPCDGLLQRTWTARDSCGNESSCVQNILVFDNIPPVLSNWPPDITVNGSYDAMGACTAFVQLITPTATDNCDPSVTLTNNINNTNNASGIFPGGQTTVIWTATDTCGNAATCSFIVIVECDTCCNESQNIIANGSFTGLPGGDLLANSVPWYAADLSPQVSTSDGCNAPGMAQMWGNSIVGEVMGQSDSPVMFKSGWTYRVSFCAKYININNLPPYLAHGWFNLRAGTSLSTVNGPACTSCTTIGQSPVLNQDNVWEQVCLPDWTAPTDYDRLFVNFQNSSFTNDGDSVSWGRIDDICIEVIDSIVCCEDFEEFCQILDNEVSISVSNDSCKATVNIGNLQDCDYIEYIDWGPQVSQGPFPAGSMPMYVYPVSGTYEICYLAIELDTAGFICFEKIVCDTITILCDTCVCAPPSLELTTGNTIIPLTCNEADPNLWPVLPCPVQPVTISGTFGCFHPSTGIPCADTPVNWTMQYADGSVSTGVINNDPVIHFHEGLIDTPGTYCLTFSTLCPGAIDSCICKVSWVQEDCGSCCNDFDEFCQTLENEVTISVDNDSCKATVNIGNLPDCDYLEYVDWGDGSIDNGPFTSGSMTMHVYPGSGSYEICYLAVELDETGFICFEKIVCDTIDLVCNPCCTDSIGFFNTAANVQTNGELGNCMIHFNAMGLDSCMQITYVWGDNTANDGPHGNNVAVWHTYPGPGTYTVCYFIEEVDENGNICWVYEFCEDVLVLCDSCCLDFDAFCQNLENEVSISVDNDSCKATFNVGNLPDCDYLEFVDWGDGSLDTGPFTTGSMTMHVYPGSGIYEICYLAFELDEAGNICFEKIVCDTIDLDCNSCCSEDLEEFCQVIENATSVTVVTSDTCKVTFNVGNLPDCDRIEWIDWGDGNLDNGPFSSGTMLTHFYPNNGPFIVSWLAVELDATGAICFEKVLSDTILCTVGIDDPNQAYQIDLFPNPTTGEITLQFAAGSPNNGKVQIIDLWGRTLATEFLVPGIKDHSLTLSPLPEGIYFVKVTENGVPVWVEKVIKQ